MVLDFSSLFVMVISDVNILIWNCRGAVKRNFAGFIKDLRKNYGFSILVLLETRISGLKADRISSQLGYDGMFRVDPDGFAGGIWIFWDMNLWKLDILNYDSQVVHMKIGAIGSEAWYFSACYGRPQRVIRESLWNSLKNFHSLVDGSWLVAGDFNAVVHDWEVMGS